MDEAHTKFKSNTDGQNSQVYPALARVPSDLFGICVVGTSGNVYAVGDTDHEFSIMSVSKPFLFSLICEVIGAEKAREKLGANATGYAFNSVAGIERSPNGRTNPMVNAGAIATTSLVPGANVEAKWKFIHDGLSQFAGRKLPMNEEVLKSALGDEFSQPEHRAVPAQREQHLLRADGSRGAVYAAMFVERERQGPGGDGRHIGGRGREPVTKEDLTPQARTRAASSNGCGPPLYRHNLHGHFQPFECAGRSVLSGHRTDCGNVRF